LASSVHPEAADGIAIIFDKGIESERLNAIAKAYMQHIEDEHLVSLIFARIERTLPLQGADMVATETYWYTQDWLDKRDDVNARAHFQHYLNNMRAQGMALGRAEIEADMKRRGPDGLVR
jgi:hypothetical protein